MRALAVAVLILAFGCASAGAPGTTDEAVPPSNSPSTPADPNGLSPRPTSPIAVLGPIVETRSEVARNPPSAATAHQLADMVAADRAFAFDLYRTLVAVEDGNLFLSPYSISTAMSMALAGARGRTAAELATALGVSADQDTWHLARNRLELDLAALGNYDPPGGGDAVPLTLEPTNALFGQTGYPFKPAFLDVLAANYGAGMNALDFATQPEPSRVGINDSVAERTRDRIDELLPLGSIDALTRAVLVNAIYFKASWLSSFDPALTENLAFYLLDGSMVDVPMMHGTARSLYAAGDGWQAVDLRYVGQASMLIIVPDEGRFAEIEGSLDAALLADVVDQLEDYEVDLRLPRWESTSDLDLIPPLEALGVQRLFQAGAADLTGIADVADLVVSDVLHQADISVDEKGTEAAAATAVVFGELSAPPPASLTVDRPFFYFIRDGSAGEILFMGRLIQP
jgi:serpin B